MTASSIKDSEQISENIEVLCCSFYLKVFVFVKYGKLVPVPSLCQKKILCPQSSPIRIQIPQFGIPLTAYSDPLEILSDPGHIYFMSRSNFLMELDEKSGKGGHHCR